MAKSTSPVKKWWQSFTITEKTKLTNKYYPKKIYTKLTGEQIKFIYNQEKNKQS